MTAPTSPPGSPLPFTARTPEDVLALVPVVLGFAPRDSVVMLTFGAAQPFHARVDLPGTGGGLAEMVAALLEPARWHAVMQVLLVVYSPEPSLARRASRALRVAFGDAGIGVIEVLRADGRRWWPAEAGSGAAGIPYDVSAHPFSARAVLEGRVLHGSREELRATIAAAPALSVGVVAALARECGDGLPDPDWAADLVTRHSRDGTVPDDAELARLLRGLLDGVVRDAVCRDLRRATAPALVGFWTEVVRRSPAPLLAGPAALLALTAWQAGDGALAWCALDRCAEVDEAYPLAALVAQALLGAVPPGLGEADPPVEEAG